jgi:hypothetical protein
VVTSGRGDIDISAIAPSSGRLTNWALRACVEQAASTRSPAAKTTTT